MPVETTKSNGQWQTTIKGKNGEIIYWTERYKNKKDAKATKEIAFAELVKDLAKEHSFKWIAETVAEILGQPDEVVVESVMAGDTRWEAEREAAGYMNALSQSAEGMKEF